MNINEFWKAVIAQDEQEIRKYFREDAYINWHCTNEHFNLDEYIIANCEYPGEWDGVVERIEEMDDLLVTVAKVYLKDKSISFHVTSFAKIVDERIASLDEYWADDMSEAPDEINEKIIRYTKRFMQIIKEVYGCERVYMCTMCDGLNNHYHVQLIPRYDYEKRGSVNFVKQRKEYVHDAEKSIE